MDKKTNLFFQLFRSGTPAESRSPNSTTAKQETENRIRLIKFGVKTRRRRQQTDVVDIRRSVKNCRLIAPPTTAGGVNVGSSRPASVVKEHCSSASKEHQQEGKAGPHPSKTDKVCLLIIYSWLLRCSTARGSSTRLSLVGPTKVKARKYLQ